MNTPKKGLEPYRSSYAMPPERAAIYDLLYSLGITANYVGFHHIAYALELTTREPERLLLVTKWLYPDVARHFGTSDMVTERAMRVVVGVSWNLRADTLQKLTGFSSSKKPCTSQYLSILTSYLLREKAA